MRFCSYFDHRYLPRFLVLYDSLRRVRPEAAFTVLCLDDKAAEGVERLGLADVEVLRLAELEAYEPRLPAAREDRSLVEYYFTCSPVLPLWVLDHHQVEAVTYLDADLFVLGPIEPLLDELGESSVAIIPHRYPPDRQEDLVWGTYNVGWLTFRADAPARQVLERWRDQCLEWCHDTAEPDGRFADQGYLNDWPEVFPEVAVLQHPGANLAPWNVRTHALSDGERLLADGQAVVFFHVQGLRRLSPHVFRLGLESYGAKPTPALLRHVYRPYVAALMAADERVAAVLDGPAAAPLRLVNSAGGMGGRLRLLRSGLRRDLLRV
jgi:hypothetical protein